MPKGRCKLCLQENKDLRKSHFLGRALYKLNMEGGEPVMMTPQIIMPTTRQLWAHLLCAGCEQCFNKRGERVVMSLVQRKGGFRLLNLLNVAMAMEQHGRMTVFSGTDTGIDTEQLAYFALSVIWRSAVRKWRTLKEQTTSISLGAYEEPIRQYLAGEADFPENVVVLVTVCTDFGSRNMVFAPSTTKATAYPYHAFLARGIWFRVFTGANLPQDIRDRCCVTSARKPIFMEDCEDGLLHAARRLHKTAKIAPRLQKLP
jgi:hypothetical protein